MRSPQTALYAQDTRLSERDALSNTSAKIQFAQETPDLEKAGVASHIAQRAGGSHHMPRWLSLVDSLGA